MFDVYISNYKSGNNIVSTKTKMLSIPSSPGNGFPIDKPNVKCSEDNADSFDFQMEMNSPYYDALLPLKTRIIVEYDGDTIFYGRVFSISNRSIFQSKSVHCEGSFSFMNDTFYEGKPEKAVGKISWSTYLNKLLQNHNNQVSGESWKEISLGTVDFTPTTTSEKYEPSSWTQTSSLVKDLVSEYGGHMRIRYANNTSYLDWYKYYARDLGNSRPSVTVGKNILDISSDIDVDNIFTMVIPIGSSESNSEPLYVNGYKYTDKNGTQHTFSGKAIPVTLLTSLYSDGQLNDEFHSVSDYSNSISDYGKIYKTLQNGDANTKAKLWNYAVKWIKECYYGIASSFTIKAIDMHIKDSTIPKILVGDCVNVNYPITRNGVLVHESRKLVCKTAQYDLFNPENNSYTFGIPSDLLKRTSSRKRAKQKTQEKLEPTSNRPSGGGSPQSLVYYWSDIARLIRGYNSTGDGWQDYAGTAAADSFEANGEIYFTADNFYDPAVTNDPRNNPDALFSATVVGKITLAGKSTKWIAFSPNYGIFAFIRKNDDFNEVSFRYLEHKGAQYKSKIDLAMAAGANGALLGIGFDLPEKPLVSVGGNHGSLTDYPGGKIDLFDGIHSPNEPSLSLIVNSDLARIEAFNPTTAKPTVKIGSDNNYPGGKIDLFDGIHESSPSIVADAQNVLLSIKNPSNSKTLVNIGSDNEYKGGKVDVHQNLQNSQVPQSSIVLDGATNSLQMFGAIGSAFNGIKTINFDASGTGQVKVGKKTTSQTNEYNVTINDTVSFEDPEDKTHIITVQGVVTAVDLNLPEIPSFKTKTIVVDNLIAGRATVEQFNALEANFNSLKSKSITTDNLSSQIANLEFVHVTNLISDSGYIMTPYIYIGTVGNAKPISLDAIKDIQVADAGNNQLKLQIKNFGTYSDSWHDVPNSTFKRAASIENAGAWSGSGRTVIKWTVTESSTNKCIVELADGNATGNSQLSGSWDGLTYTGKIGYVVAETGGTKQYDATGLTYQVSGTTPRNTGWNNCRNAMEIPTNAIEAYVDNTYATIVIKKPDENAASTKTEYTFTMSNNNAFKPKGSSTNIAVVELKYGSNVVARKSVTVPTVTFSADDKGTTKVDSNDNDITVSVKMGSTEVKKATQTIHMVVGSWGDGKCLVTSRLTNSSGNVVCKKVVSLPSSGTWNKNYLGTGGQYKITHTLGGKEYSTTMSF